MTAPFSREVSRRTVVKAGVWAVPVIAAAIAVPAHAASTPLPVCGGTPGDNGSYTVQGRVLVIQYRTAPDIYEVNARAEAWSRSYGTNYGTAPARGSLTWTIELPGIPSWVQVHGFNSHFGEVC